jgi:hypothetical protein
MREIGESISFKHVSGFDFESAKTCLGIARLGRRKAENMKRLAHGVAICWIILAVSTSAQGARNRQIIFGPVTITESGVYVVASDISVLTPPAITVMAPNVTIDLGGHSVGTPGFGNGDVMLLSLGAQRLQIANGRLVGGTQCISSSAVGVSLSMDHITCTGGKYGIQIPSASAVSITHSELSPARDALLVDGAYSLQFDGNVVRQALPYPAGISCGVSFFGITNGSITDNSFECTAYDASLMSLRGTGLVRVERNSLVGFDTRACLELDGRFIVRGNVIEGCRTAIRTTGDDNSITNNTISNDVQRGVGIEMSGSDNTVVDNALSYCLYGINVGGSRNRISRNSVLFSDERGVTVFGSENLISGNRIQSGFVGHSDGLVLFDTSSGNVYRNNDLSGTTGIPIQDFGIDNVDAGGNVW